MRIDVRVIPNAARTGITGTRGNEFVLRVNAPATEGKANKAVAMYLARTFGVARSAVHLVAGEKSRHKKFEISFEGVSEEIQKTLKTLILLGEKRFDSQTLYNEIKQVLTSESLGNSLRRRTKRKV